MRRNTKKGYITGIGLSFLIIVILSLPIFDFFHMPGNLNTGHENLTCNECHEESSGTFRQQVQANLYYFLGLRVSSSVFNFETPDNKDCIACHDRNNDKHPVYRFNEPRFEEAREKVKAQYCVSCHQEHHGVRVTSDPENCQYCHQETIVKDDPLDTSHKDLIDSKKWDSCLGCHDFHGNHEVEAPINGTDMIHSQRIDNYLRGGPDPYTPTKTFKAKESRYENKPD